MPAIQGVLNSISIIKKRKLKINIKNHTDAKSVHCSHLFPILSDPKKLFFCRKNAPWPRLRRAAFCLFRSTGRPQTRSTTKLAKLFQCPVSMLVTSTVFFRIRICFDQTFGTIFWAPNVEKPCVKSWFLVLSKTTSCGDLNTVFAKKRLQDHWRKTHWPSQHQVQAEASATVCRCAKIWTASRRNMYIAV